MGEFERGTEYATNALSAMTSTQREQWALQQSHRIGLSFGGEYNNAIKKVLVSRGLWPTVDQI